MKYLQVPRVRRMLHHRAPNAPNPPAAMAGRRACVRACLFFSGGDILLSYLSFLVSLLRNHCVQASRLAGGGLHAAQQACRRVELRRRQPRRQEKMAAHCAARATATRVSAALACFSNLLFPAFPCFPQLFPAACAFPHWQEKQRNVPEKRDI